MEQSRRSGSLALDLRSGEVQKNGRRVKLQEQPFQVLAALVERPGEVVTREELRQRVWPENTFVDFNNGLNIAIVKLRQALNDDATNPRYIETLPKRGYRFIAAVEAGKSQEKAPSPPKAETTEAVKRGRGNSTLALATMAGIALAAFGFGWGQLFPQNARPAAAVIGFRNLTADASSGWLSMALAEMLSTELAAGDGLRTISGESVARARVDLRLTETDSYSAETLARIRKNLGADYVIVGSFFNRAGQPLRLDLRLQDARGGQTVAAISQSGSQDNLPDLVARAGLALRQKLNLAAAGQADTRSVRAAMPAKPDTARLYAEGLNLLRRFDAAGARVLFELVVKSDPAYAMAHAALARTWTESGYGERAKQEARKAWDLSHDLPRADRLASEATYRTTTGEWDRAAQLYQQLRDLYPDEVDYGVRLAAAEVKAGKAKEALTLLDKLHQLAAPLRDDAAIDFTQSLAAEQAGDLRQSEAAAAKAAAGAEGRGMQMLVAEARAQECRVLRLLGRPDPARAACERAREIYAGAGDRGGAATITGYLAAIRADEGDLTEAGELYGRALMIDREIGNEGDAIWQLNGLADVLESQGDLTGARRRFGEALEIARRTGSHPARADLLDNVAAMCVLEGDLAQARKGFEEALAQYREIPDKSGVGNALGNLGETMYLQGDLAGAAQTLDQAVAADREAGSQAETADALSSYGRVLLAQGNLDGARRRYDESLRMWTAMGSPGYVARHRLRFAELAIEGGRAADAEAPIREGLEIFQREKQRDVEIEARTLLARVLLEEGKTPEALREIELSGRLVKGSQNRGVRLVFEMAAARVRAAAGKSSGASFSRSKAMRALPAVIADAGVHGFLGYQLEGRLALGEAELRAGHVDARTHLEMVEKDARNRGFGLIARHAAALQGQAGAPR